MKETKMFKRLNSLIAFVVLAITASQVAATQTVTTNSVTASQVKKVHQPQIEQKSITVALYSSEAEDPWFDESELDIKFKKRLTGAEEDEA